MARQFADTYALIELLKGNPNYERYSQDNLLATEFNLLELAYALLKEFGSVETEKIVKSVRDSIEILPTEDSDYLDASEFRKSV